MKLSRASRRERTLDAARARDEIDAEWLGRDRTDGSGRNAIPRFRVLRLENERDRRPCRAAPDADQACIARDDELDALLEREPIRTDPQEQTEDAVARVGRPACGSVKLEGGPPVPGAVPLTRG